jgi:hypothetical protein
MIWRKVTEFPQYSVNDSGLVRNDITGLILMAMGGLSYEETNN